MKRLWVGLMLMIAALPARAEEWIAAGGRRVAVWGGEAPEGRPVVLFSHGFRGCATQARFLVEALDRAGYLVFAPNHLDAGCAEGGDAPLLAPPERPFDKPESWGPETHADRARDLRALVRELPDDDRWALADWRHVAIIGHSLGGYAAIALAGGWEGEPLPGLTAVIALSPYVQPFVRHDRLRGLTVPIMYQGGSGDHGTTPLMERTGGVYDQSPSPKALVVFDGADHMAWTDRKRQSQGLITAYAMAFLDYFVKGAAVAPILEKKMSGVTRLDSAGLVDDQMGGRAEQGEQTE